MEEIKVSASPREKTGVKGALSGMRRDKNIPAVVYGGEKPSMPITVSAKDLGRLLKMGSNIIINLEISGAQDKVLLQEVQHHVVTNAPLHADFKRISMKEKLQITVPIKIMGEATGVKQHGGMLEHVLREVSVRCLPADIPHEIAVNIEPVDIGMAIRIKDLAAPKGVELLDEPERLVLHVLVPREEAVETPAAAAAGAAEPEVIAKGKKEEEGAAAEGGDKKAEAPKAAAAAAAPKAQEKK